MHCTNIFLRAIFVRKENSHHKKYVKITSFQQEQCLRRILAQPGRIISVVYQLDDGEFVIDECAEALEGAEGLEGQVTEGADDDDGPGIEDLDELFEAARRSVARGRLETFWRRCRFGKMFSINSYSSNSFSS